MERKYFFDIVVNREKLSTGESVFVAHCTTIGITSQGHDMEHAMKNIKEAVRLYLEESPEKLKDLTIAECPPTFSFIEVNVTHQKISISN